MPRRRSPAGGGALTARLPVLWTARALAASAIIPPLLEMMSFARVERLLVAAARVPAGRAPEDEVAARWVDRLLARLPWPWTNTCLRRASVLYYLLRAAGTPVELCIGVRRAESGNLGAHAWLLLNGALYLEGAGSSERISDYSVIARFPPARAP
ncbi:MAG: lasso peptide biosynthesis B2 protein [bacterium]